MAEGVGYLCILPSDNLSQRDSDEESEDSYITTSPTAKVSTTLSPTAAGVPHNQTPQPAGGEDGYILIIPGENVPKHQPLEVAGLSSDQVPQTAGSVGNYISILPSTNAPGDVPSKPAGVSPDRSPQTPNGEDSYMVILPSTNTPEDVPPKAAKAPYNYTPQIAYIDPLAPERLQRSLSDEGTIRWKGLVNSQRRHSSLEDISFIHSKKPPENETDSFTDNTSPSSADSSDFVTLLLNGSVRNETEGTGMPGEEPPETIEPYSVLLERKFTSPYSTFTLREQSPPPGQGIDTRPAAPLPETSEEEALDDDDDDYSYDYIRDSELTVSCNLLVS